MLAYLTQAQHLFLDFCKFVTNDNTQKIRLHEVPKEV